VHVRVGRSLSRRTTSSPPMWLWVCIASRAAEQTEARSGSFGGQRWPGALTSCRSSE
jgi:hypothetical protein